MTELQAFRNEISNYLFYLDKIKKLEEKKEDLFYKYFGIHGIDPSKESIENKNYTAIELQKIENLEKYDELRKEIDLEIEHYKKRINIIKNRLGRMDDLTRKEFEYVYIKKYSYYKTCRLLDISIGELQYNMKKAFKED